MGRHNGCRMKSKLGVFPCGASMVNVMPLFEIIYRIGYLDACV